MSYLRDLEDMTFAEALSRGMMRWIRWRWCLPVYDWDSERWTTRTEWRQRQEPEGKTAA